MSICIVTYNSATDLEACLVAVTAAATRTSTELVIVDNASSDGSLSLARTLAPTATVLAQTSNLGFAGACNAAVSVARGEFVLLLNPDAVMQPGCLDALVTHAEAHPRQTPLGGRCLHPDGTVDPRSCWGAPTLWSTLCFATGLSSVARGSSWFNPEGLGGWQRDSPRAVGVVTGFLLLIQRRVWHELGGLDERFFVYGEDVDFSVRARAAGRVPFIVPTAEVRHEAGASSASVVAKLLLLYAGKVTLMHKHWSRPAARVGVTLLELGLLVRATGKADARQLLLRRREWRNGFPPRDPVTA